MFDFLFFFSSIQTFVCVIHIFLLVKNAQKSHEWIYLSFLDHPMSSLSSNETMVKQLSSGILTGGVIGTLFGRGQYLIGYLAFSSIGLMDFAYHWNYTKAHITHLTLDRVNSTRELRSRWNDLQRGVQRELRDQTDDINQELRWVWNDLRRYIDEHAFYGMGFTMAFLLTVVLIPKARR